MGGEGRRGGLRYQRPELRALQDLRYQGPEPEHQLGATTGWRGAGLRQYVTGEGVEKSRSVCFGDVIARYAAVTDQVRLVGGRTLLGLIRFRHPGLEPVSSATRVRAAKGVFPAQGLGLAGCRLKAGMTEVVERAKNVDPRCLHNATAAATASSPSVFVDCSSISYI